MPAIKKDVRKLARAHTDAAIKTLVGIMNSPDAQPSARVTAANAVLDRGWGKAVQPHDGDGDGSPIKVVFETVFEKRPE